MSNANGLSRWLCCWLLGLASCSAASRAVDGRPLPQQRRVTVADAIEMTRWADKDYFLGGDAQGRVGLFSPDGKQFVLVLRRGNIELNTNEYSLLLFQTKEVFQAPRPRVLLTMSSTSNRDAITHVKWLDDSETVVFLGEDAGKSPQVWSFHIRTNQLQKLTNHPTPITAYDISADGKQIVFEGYPRKALNRESIRKRGVIITTQDPTELIANDCDSEHEFEAVETELFVQAAGHAPANISSRDYLTALLPLSLSPNGRYALLTVYVRDIPPSWAQYREKLLHNYVVEQHLPGKRSNVKRFMLLDIESGELTPVLNTPVSWFNAGFAWVKDGNSVVLSGAYLPLDIDDPAEVENRKKHTFVVEVNLLSKEILKITDKNLSVTKWDQLTGKVLLAPEEEDAESKKLPPEAYAAIGSKWKQVPVTSEDTKLENPLDVTLGEDINSPPRLLVSETKNHRTALLMDLNPQFSRLKFGKVEAVTWRATDGHDVAGGLYLPPDYTPGTRYPLVIQTHGFRKDRFWMNGPWTSAFAAQPLAAKDIIVLQVGYSTDPGEDAKYVQTPQEAPRQMAAYEGAIDYLDRRGLVDRNRVGLLGFSRTVYYVEYTLTHSLYRFTVASLADGVDGGYLNYLLFPNVDYALVNGGPPTGPSFAAWLKNSPGFNLDKVSAAVRLEYYGSQMFLAGWQWFSGLSLLEKPVDFVWLPKGTHLLLKPWEQLTSQQGNVDWFAFWLKGEKDLDPQKQDQYRRWEEFLVRFNRNQNSPRIPRSE